MQYNGLEIGGNMRRLSCIEKICVLPLSCSGKTGAGRNLLANPLLYFGYEQLFKRLHRRWIQMWRQGKKYIFWFVWGWVEDGRVWFCSRNSWSSDTMAQYPSTFSLLPTSWEMKPTFRGNTMSVQQGQLQRRATFCLFYIFHCQIHSSHNHMHRN